MPGQVPVHVARERNRVLREIAAERNRAFRESFIGRTLEVITLQAGGDGWTEALSDNFLKVRVAGRHRPNEWTKAEIEGVGDENLLAVAPARAALAV
jgi:threonylcarbamoyladenosine tRNA methylthiotransferase MtaB